MVFDSRGTPVIANLFKLGTLLHNFVPKAKVDVVCKVGYVQETLVNPDLSTIFDALKPNSTVRNIVLEKVPGAEDIIFTNAPTLEISYDGIVTDAKLLYQRITGLDEDFFDVDFEDEDDEAQAAAAAAAAAVRAGPASGTAADNEMAIDDSSDDDHHPFATSEMEL